MQEKIYHYSKDQGAGDFGSADVEALKNLASMMAETMKENPEDLYELSYVQSIISKLITANEPRFATISLHSDGLKQEKQALEESYIDKESIKNLLVYKYKKDFQDFFMESYRKERQIQDSDVNILIVNEQQSHWPCVIIDRREKKILLFDPKRDVVFEMLSELFKSSSDDFNGFSLYQNTSNFQIGGEECGPVTIEFIIRACKIDFWKNSFESEVKDPNVPFNAQIFKLLSYNIPNNANILNGKPGEEIKDVVETISLGVLRESHRGLLLDVTPLGGVPRLRIEELATEEVASEFYIESSRSVTPGNPDVDTESEVSSSGISSDAEVNNNKNEKAEANKRFSIISSLLQVAIIAFIIRCIKYIIQLPSKLLSATTSPSDDKSISPSSYKESISAPSSPRKAEKGQELD